MLKLVICFFLPLSLYAQPHPDRPCEITPPPCECAGEISATIAALKKNKAYQRQTEAEFANHVNRVKTELAADPDGNLNCSFYLGYLVYGIRDGHAYVRTSGSISSCSEGKEAYYKAIRNSEYFTRTPRYNGAKADLLDAVNAANDKVAGVYNSISSDTPFGILPTELEGEYSAYVLTDRLKKWDFGQELLRFFPLPGAYGAFVRDDKHQPYFYRGKTLAGLLRTFGLMKRKGGVMNHRPDKDLESGKLLFPKPGIGYVHIRSFSGSNSNVNMLNATYDSLALRLTFLTHLIIDVRNNTGGGERAFNRLFKVLNTHAAPLEIHLLVNEGTASAAELFALKMKKRGAKIYGERTRGAVAYRYGNNKGTLPFLTPCGNYRVQLTEGVNKPKSLFSYEYVGIPVDVPLSHEQDWLKQLLQLI